MQILLHLKAICNCRFIGYLIYSDVPSNPQYSVFMALTVSIKEAVVII